MAAKVFVCAAVVATVATPLVRNLALRRGLLDVALDSRKIHGRPVPRLGGVAIVLAFATAIGSLLLGDSHPLALSAIQRDRLAAVLVAGALVAALGVYDDLHGASARTKFAVQFLVGALMCRLGFAIEAISLPVVGTVHLGWLGVPLTLVWIAGVVNAVNLIDGLDGLAGGVSFIAAAALLAIAAADGDHVRMVVAAAVAGAVLGFLFYNFNPASIFMGDTGSLFLGFALAVTSIHVPREAPGVPLLVPVVLLGLPIGDTLLSMARRALRGVPMFSADRGHVHHRLLRCGLTHRQAVLAMYAFAILLALVAVVVAHASAVHAVAALALLGVAAATCLRSLGLLDGRGLRAGLRRRRRNRELRDGVALIADELRTAAGPAALWESLRQAGPVFGAEHVALRVDSREPRRPTFTCDAPADPEDLMRASYPVGPHHRSSAVLELGWRGRQRPIDRDTEIAVERLCSHLAKALARVGVPVEAVGAPSRRVPPRPGSYLERALRQE
jgi:UDP-GlcNAc:undecaprenyl-phosphate GlcNAc-1-phosphate transferase